MTTQPDALRLADLLEMGSIWQDQEKAATELRRMSAVEAQRDALLEALKGVLRVADRKTDEFDAARAAIAKAEGEEA